MKIDPIGGHILTYFGCCQGITKILLTIYRKMDPIGGPTLTYSECYQGFRKILLATYRKMDPIGRHTLTFVGVVRNLGKFYRPHIGKWTLLEELP